MADRPHVRTRLGARGITRRFGEVLANDHVELEVAPASIHGVVGENGAGKTTLMRILYGLDRPDDGEVVLDDQPVTLRSPREAIARGIGMVHQEFMLVPDLTLLENLVLGDEPRRRGLVDWTAARRRADELERSAGVHLDWDVTAARTSVAGQQRLEILRLLYRGADVLILDEPTAVLAPAQVQELFELLRRLRTEGRSVVFISHKLDEVLELADAVTVLRGGRSVATRPASELDPAALARLMVGDATDVASRPRTGQPGAVVLETHRLRAHDDRGVERLADASLQVREAEIVGVAGVADNGQDELVEALVGIRRVAGGTVHLTGEEVTGASTEHRRRLGLAFVSADRAHEGLAVDASLRDNVLAGHQRDDDLLGPGTRLRHGAIEAFVADVLDRYRVHRDSPDDPASSLSGGNQQRLIIGRELSSDPAVVVAAQPTRGVDINGIAAVHDELLAARDRGAGVLVVSEELDELFALCDRIVVLSRGEVVGEVPADPHRREELGRLMMRVEPA